MNNKFLLFAVIIVAAMVFAVSCNKDTMNKVNRDNQDAYSTMVIQRIQNFQLQMQSTYKSGTTMPLDSAVWDLEALITNYGAFPDSISKDFTLKKAQFTISVDGSNNVSNSDVQALYQRMVDTITAQLATINSSVKFLAFSDVQQDSVIGTTAYLSTNNGYGYNFILGLYEPFTDSWIWGTLDNPEQPPYAGNCAQTDFSSDGSNEIQYRLNHPAVLPWRTGYTNLETKYTNGSFFVDANGNPRLYWDPTHDGMHCMSIAELTDNLVNADDIIKTYNDPDPNTGDPMGLRPHGKSFVRVNIIDDMIPNGGSNYPYLHNYEVTYGKPYTITYQ